MPRVLLSAPVNNAMAKGLHLKAALTDIGCQVLLFDFRYTAQPNQEILRLADSYKPHVHIIWKGNGYTPQTLRELLRRHIYNVLWHPDEIIAAWLPPLAQAADLVCVQTRDILPQLIQAGVQDPEWLMEGFTLSAFTYDSLSLSESRKYSCDVVIIGTVNPKTGYSRRWDAINKLARQRINVRWWGRHVPICLNTLRDYLSPAARAWGGARLHGPDYAKACHCAKIFLTYPLFPNLAGGLSSRAFMATGVRAFYLSLYKAGMEEFFEPDKEIVVFRDDDEMLEKVQYYLDHGSRRQGIARAGQARCLRDYTNQRVFQRLFSLIAAHDGPEYKLAQKTG